MSTTILLVEDEPAAAQMLKLYLEVEGYTLVWAEDGPAAEAAFHANAPALAIIDVMLPGFDGIELCKRIRKTSFIPIILLTAQTMDVQKAIGLGSGADDYITKPYSPVELIARIKALLRRSYDFQPPVAPTKLLGGPRLLLDPKKFTITLDGIEVNTTVLEFRILEELMRHPGWVYSRLHLLQQVWEIEDESGVETVTVHVSNLRKKLGATGEQLIKTVRGVGYVYQEETS